MWVNILVYKQAEAQSGTLEIIVVDCFIKGVC